MKRSIMDVDQAAAVEAGLTLREIVFMDWFAYWQGSGKMNEHESGGKRFYWVSRAKVLEDLPLLQLSDESRVSRFIGELVKKGMLERVRVSNDARRGSRSYVKTTDRWYALRYDHVSESTRENDDHVSESTRESTGPRVKNDTSDTPPSLNTPPILYTSRADARVAEPRQPPALRDELQRYIDEQMRAVQPYENYGRERGQIKTLAARCRRRDAEHPEHVADAMLTAFRALRDGEDDWWSKQPYTPSVLSSLWERIEAAGGKIAEEMRREREWKAWVAEG